MSTHDLCDFEQMLLRHLNGEHFDDLQWGGAMGVALETLKGRRLTARTAGRWGLTEAGKAMAEQLQATARADCQGEKGKRYGG